MGHHGVGEAPALHGGEADEKRGLTQRFGALIENWWGIMTATKRLTFFTAGYSQVAIIFPIVVASPAYFAGTIQLGGLIQTSSAFGLAPGAVMNCPGGSQPSARLRSITVETRGTRRGCQRP